MNFNQIFSDIEKQDPEIYERMDTRRESMRRFTRLGGKIALTALPLALGSMFKKAYGGTNSSITDVLNFALTLEYLEAAFYQRAIKTPGLIKGASVYEGFVIIAKHESEHVQFLSKTISSLGATPVSRPKFDFTAGGAFPTVFSDYATFLALSQAFEDTGVRAYKGQAGNLITSNIVLTAALQIHSVEARHASFVRTLRERMANDETIRPWITGNSTSGIGAAVAGNYAGEENTSQLGIEIVGINGFSIDNDDATECFDEPLSMSDVLTLVGPFIVG